MKWHHKGPISTILLRNQSDKLVDELRTNSNNIAVELNIDSCGFEGGYLYCKANR